MTEPGHEITKLHRRSYLAFLALLTAWVLAVVLVPGADETAPATAAQQGAGPASAAEAPTQAIEGPEGTASTTAAPVGPGREAGLPDDVALGPTQPGRPPSDDPDLEDGEPEPILPPGVEDDFAQALKPVVGAGAEFYAATAPAWEALNSVIGSVLTPVLVDLALAISPAVSVLTEIAGGDLREACGYIGLIMTLYGFVGGTFAPPIDMAALLLPVFVVCGTVFESGSPDDEAVLLGLIDFPF